MNRRYEFLDVLLRGAEPSPGLLAAFALGLLMVGILSNLAYDLLTACQDCLGNVLRSLGASVVLMALAYVFFRYDRRRKRSLQADVDESRLAPAHTGLIWMLGPGRFDHLIFALTHHQKRGGGQHCWLVMQDILAVKDAFSRLTEELLDLGLTTALHPVYIEELDVEAAYKAVRSVFDREAEEEGVDPSEVLADITGGTKPLTAGMVLASLITGRSIEYVESERDAQGNPILDTLRAVLVDTAFYLETQA